jgi:WD40 repeat protein
MNHLSFSKDNSFVVFIWQHESAYGVQKYDLLTHGVEHILDLEFHSHSYTTLEIFENDAYLFIINGQKCVEMWNIETKKCIRQFYADDVYTCYLTPDETLLIGLGDHIHVWSFETGDLIHKFIRDAPYGVYTASIAFVSPLSEDSLFCMSCHEVEIFNYKTFENRVVFNEMGYTSFVTAQILSSGLYFYNIKNEENETLVKRSIENGNIVEAFPIPGEASLSFSMSKDETFLAILDFDGNIIFRFV